MSEIITYQRPDTAGAVAFEYEPLGGGRLHGLALPNGRLVGADGDLPDCLYDELVEMMAVDTVYARYGAGPHHLVPGTVVTASAAGRAIAFEEFGVPIADGVFLTVTDVYQIDDERTEGLPDRNWEVHVRCAWEGPDANGNDGRHAAIFYVEHLQLLSESPLFEKAIKAAAAHLQKFREGPHYYAAA